MNWKSKKVLVTGAGGFIGSHLVEKLVAAGSEVNALVRYNSRNDWGQLEELPKSTREKITVHSGDVRDAERMRDITKGIEYIFHLAAVIPIPYSYVSPRDSIETNVLGTFNMAIAARDNKVKKFIHTSTSETYGSALYIPMDEKHPLQAQSPYSAGKIGADKIVESFHLSYGLPAVTVRPFNAYGPRQSARAVIPTIITQALTSRKIKLGSRFPTRDFTYVTDTAEGFIKAAEGSKSTEGSVFNIGMNTEISIGDLVDKITNIIGEKCEVTYDKERVRPKKSEVSRLWCENKLAVKELGWGPEQTLDSGLKLTIDWITRNIKKYKPELYNI